MPSQGRRTQRWTRPPGLRSVHPGGRGGPEAQLRSRDADGWRGESPSGSRASGLKYTFGCFLAVWLWANDLLLVPQFPHLQNNGANHNTSLIGPQWNCFCAPGGKNSPIKGLGSQGPGGVLKGKPWNDKFAATSFGWLYVFHGLDLMKCLELWLVGS